MSRPLEMQRASVFAALSAAEGQYKEKIAKAYRLYRRDQEGWDAQTSRSGYYRQVHDRPRPQPETITAAEQGSIEVLRKGLLGPMLKLSDLATVCARWLWGKDTPWNSKEANSLASYFLQQLEDHDRVVYKAVISTTYSVEFVSASASGSYVNLYRGDSRAYETIFREGFTLRKPYAGSTQLLGTFCDQYTESYGVSTSQWYEQAAQFPLEGTHHVYTIRVDSHVITGPGTYAVDIAQTRSKRGGIYKQRSDLHSLREVNFLHDIPPQVVHSVKTAEGDYHLNPSYTGKFPHTPTYKPVPPLLSETRPASMITPVLSASALPRTGRSRAGAGAGEELRPKPLVAMGSVVLLPMEAAAVGESSAPAEKLPPIPMASLPVRRPAKASASVFCPLPELTSLQPLPPSIPAPSTPPPSSSVFDGVTVEAGPRMPIEPTRCVTFSLFKKRRPSAQLQEPVSDSPAATARRIIK
ncbi:MAG: hypothetical protein P1U63_12315 [Coxiellaceae bacterium]|nr:hypothetical protein [Coxiellaceae bacterium]